MSFRQEFEELFPLPESQKPDPRIAEKAELLQSLHNVGEALVHKASDAVEGVKKATEAIKPAVSDTVSDYLNLKKS